VYGDDLLLGVAILTRLASPALGLLGTAVALGLAALLGLGRLLGTAGTAATTHARHLVAHFGAHGRRARGSRSSSADRRGGGIHRSRSSRRRHDNNPIYIIMT